MFREELRTFTFSSSGTRCPCVYYIVIDSDTECSLDPVHPHSDSTALHGTECPDDRESCVIRDPVSAAERPPALSSTTLKAPFFLYSESTTGSPNELKITVHVRKIHLYLILKKGDLKKITPSDPKSKLLRVTGNLLKYVCR